MRINDRPVSQKRAFDSSGNGERDEEKDEGEAQVMSLAVSADFLRGDADPNGSVNLTDGILILGDLFRGTETPWCSDAADANDDGKADLTEARGKTR